MNVMEEIKKKYRNLKQSYMHEENLCVPEIYQSAFVCWGGAVDSQYIYGKFAEGLPPGANILIVGVMGGRDYYYFTNKGFKVTALDLGSQPFITPIVIHNVENPLPFKRETFDAILIGEVLEHLPMDVSALRNLYDVLKPDGRLWVSVPFYNDCEEGHLRIHSPVSARRLLSVGGFDTIDYIERPFLFNPQKLNPFVHCLSLFTFLFFGKTSYVTSGRFIGFLSYHIGKIKSLKYIRKYSPTFGGYFNCRKRLDFFDYVKLNKNLYTVDPLLPLP